MYVHSSFFFFVHGQGHCTTIALGCSACSGAHVRPSPLGDRELVLQPRLAGRAVNLGVVLAMTLDEVLIELLCRAVHFLNHRQRHDAARALHNASPRHVKTLQV